MGGDVFRVLDAISSPPLDLRFARRASSLSDCSTIASTALLLGIARRDDDRVASPLSMILLAVLCGISPNTKIMEIWSPAGTARRRMEGEAGGESPSARAPLPLQ